MGLLNVRRTALGVFPLIATCSRPIYVLSISNTRVKKRFRCGTAGLCNGVVTMVPRSQIPKMKILPDPRRYAPTSANSLVALALKAASASQHAAPEKSLVAAMTQALQAGHDAQILALRLPAAMMFVPSIGGISHHFTENTADADIVLGCQVFADAAANILRAP